MEFDPRDIQAFHFRSYDFDESSGTARFRYSFDGKFDFTEVVHFDSTPKSLGPEESAALDRCLKFLHVAAGVSYFKAAVPETIVLDSYELSPEAADFFQDLYVQGLGEFAFQNDLDLAGRIVFPSRAGVEDAPSQLALDRGHVVPIGGGKDSLLTIELMKTAGIPLRLITIGNFELNEGLAAQAGLPLLKIRRTISPLLLQINEQGAYNGHVPITAILSFIFAAAAVLYGFDTVVMSNERSSSVGNLVREDGFEVNHQYSKSLRFERRFREFLRDHLLQQLNYFSLLRPLSELDIAKRFAKLTQYHRQFTSCNGNFRIQGAPPARWCLDCPKCRFVFLSLAPFLSKAELRDVFGANLLDEPSQIRGFEQLCGVGNPKPFECVGEVEESLAAMILLSKKPEWREDSVVDHFAQKVLPGIESPASLVSEALTESTEHFVPSRYLEILHGHPAA